MHVSMHAGFMCVPWFSNIIFLNECNTPLPCNCHEAHVYAPIRLMQLLMLLNTSRRSRRFLAATFLPAGYPRTVGEGYLQYVMWQGITNLAVTANSGTCCNWAGMVDASRHVGKQTWFSHVVSSYHASCGWYM